MHAMTHACLHAEVVTIEEALITLAQLPIFVGLSFYMDVRGQRKDAKSEASSNSDSAPQGANGEGSQQQSMLHNSTAASARSKQSGSQVQGLDDHVAVPMGAVSNFKLYGSHRTAAGAHSTRSQVSMVDSQDSSSQYAPVAMLTTGSESGRRNGSEVVGGASQTQSHIAEEETEGAPTCPRII